MFKRSSGVLLHVTCLENKYGIGTLGKESYDFVNLLSKTDQKLWQVCPIGPTGFGDSPYQCFSAFAGNPLLINLEELLKLNLLTEDQLGQIFEIDEKIDYGKVIIEKDIALRKAYGKFKNKDFFELKNKLSDFFQENKEWLEDYALFMALKKNFNGKSWLHWDSDIKLRNTDSLERYKKLLKEEIDYNIFIQFLFFEDWLKLKKYANKKNIKIIGDVPIYVAMDSADSWVNSDIFMFDNEKKPLKVAGVPPDYFSKTGQLWGNPIYNWEKLEESNFNWWIKRIKASLELYDIIRIDHFRGFAEFWAVNHDEKTAINGEWLNAKGDELFSEIKNRIEYLPIIAEDLGVITKSVEKLRDKFDFPGMKILQFAFDSKEATSTFLPHMYSQNCICYTGTHDNQTTLGWFKSAPQDCKKWAMEYLNSDEKNIVKNFMRISHSSVAVFSIIPLQDIMELDDHARMNHPSTIGENWKWRFKFSDISEEKLNFFKKITNLYSR